MSNKRTLNTQRTCRRFLHGVSLQLGGEEYYPVLDDRLVFSPKVVTTVPLLGRIRGTVGAVRFITVLLGAHVGDSRRTVIG